MKYLHRGFGLIAGLCLWTYLYAASDASDPIQYEVNLWGRLHQEAKRDADAKVESLLLDGGSPKDRDTGEAGVLIARRAATICGWLRNENDYARAEKVAKRALKLIAPYAEKSDDAKIERLYWEALLLGEYVDRKKDALELVAKGRKLAPEDGRFVDLNREYSKAVAAFGH